MDDELIGIADCAALRGVSRATIQRAVQLGRIPVKRKIGNAYALKKCDCLAYAPVSHQERGRRGAAKRWMKPKPPDSA